MPVIFTVTFLMLVSMSSGGRPDLSGFWVAFIAESLRRAARNQFREKSDAVVLGVIDKILRGNPGSSDTSCQS